MRRGTWARSLSGPVAATATIEELRDALGGPLPEVGVEDEQIVAELVAGAEPGVVATGSGRYFGFVIGGALPAALAADWLDLDLGSERRARRRRAERGRRRGDLPRSGCASCSGCLLASPQASSPGCQMAHVTALAAARHHQLERAGWDVAPRRARRTLRGSASSSVRSATSRSSERSGSSASAPIRSRGFRPTSRGGCGADALRAALAARRGRSSSAPRRAT